MDSPELDQSPPVTAPAQHQDVGVALTPVVSERLETGLAAAELSDTIRALMEAGVRGQSAMMLLQTISGRLEAEIASLRGELRDVRRQSESWQERFHLEGREVTIKHRERLSHLRRGRRLQTIAIALGGVVAGLGASHLGDAAPWWGAAATVLGVILIFMGAFGNAPAAED